MARPARYGGVDLTLPQVYSGLRNAGLEHQQAANLAGVLHAESGGYTGSFYNSTTERPGALNPNGAFGLAQLNGPRQAQLLNFAGSKEAAADPQTQLNFIAQDATSGKYGNLNLYNVRSIVDKYETPRIDLRAGEAAVGSRNAATLSEASYNPNSVPGFNGVANNNNAVNSVTAPATAGGITTDAGDGTIVSQTDNPDGSASVTLGGSDASTSGLGSGAGGWDSTGGFTSANAAGSSGNGSFGLSGIMANGQAVAQDAIVGYNAAGPVMNNPTLVGATNSVAKETAKGAKQIGSDTKAAGKTIGDSVTGLAKTFQGISQTWNQWASDTFVRLAFIITGLVIFGAALMYFARPQLEAVAKMTPVGKLLPK